MGDRRNAIIVDGESKVYLYTHWTGYKLEEDIASALRRGRDRWQDGQYLARIVFCDMIEGKERGTSGFGISSVIGDGGRDITVNVDDLTVNGIPFEEWIDRYARRGN